MLLCNKGHRISQSWWIDHVEFFHSFPQLTNFGKKTLPWCSIAWIHCAKKLKAQNHFAFIFISFWRWNHFDYMEYFLFVVLRAWFCIRIWFQHSLRLNGRLKAVAQCIIIESEDVDSEKQKQNQNQKENRRWFIEVKSFHFIQNVVDKYFCGTSNENWIKKIERQKKDEEICVILFVTVLSP